MNKKVWKWISLSAIIVIVGVIGFYTHSILNFAKGINPDPENSRFKDFYENLPPENKPEYDPPVWEGKERVNILILGGDSRGLSSDEAPRSDAMMIASIDPVTKDAQLFSVLRDTYVKIPGHRSNRINAALSLGGPDLAMQTVSEWLDIPIQYYVYVDFEGFIALVDAIGGIEYEVEKDMRYESIADGPEYSIDLKKGLQHLNGEEALQYVRFRNDAMSDYARTERQRNLLQAVADKVISTSSLIKLPKILTSIEPHIETNLSLRKMLQLGSLAFDVNMSKIVSIQLPPFSLLKEEVIDGQQVITVKTEDIRNYVQTLFEQTEDETSEDETNEESEGEAETETEQSGS